MKATLYQFATSPFCSKVRKVLDYKGIDYQIVEVDYVERKELIAASGQIMVPALAGRCRRRGRQGRDDRRLGPHRVAPGGVVP
jgi:glutaredoxin